MENMQIEIEQSNQRFQRTFRLMGFSWTLVSFLSLTFASYNVFTSHPGYLHDWHGIVIILLDIIALTIYCSWTLGGFILKIYSDWPPPLQYSLPFWFSLYLCVALLSLIDQAFSWAFFIVLGASFGLFQKRTLVLFICIAFVTMCLFLGLLALPITGDNVGNIVGLGFTVLSLTIFSMWMQHLISERYERNQLLEQLSDAHTELEEAHRKLAESAAQEQELAVLRERTRLAREMHDTLGHALVLISIKLEAAQRLRERDPERCDRELESTKEIARTTMNELRASIANLRSPALEQEPACRAISRYAHEMARRSGLHVFYDLHPDIEGLPDQIEETLWKVGQEALTNVEKHARAQNVTLHISRKNGYITMRIQDDGIGFPQELCRLHANGEVTCTSPEGHYGLSGMFERVESVGGRIYLRPGQTQGTIVEVELPLVEAPLPSL
jgi:signal transduction histidine kinase